MYIQVNVRIFNPAIKIPLTAQTVTTWTFQQHSSRTPPELSLFRNLMVLVFHWEITKFALNWTAGLSVEIWTVWLMFEYMLKLWRTSLCRVSRRHPPPPEAHHHAAAVAYCHHKCKYRGCNINTVLSAIQDCEYIALGVAYTQDACSAVGQLDGSNTRCYSCCLQHKGRKVEKQSHKMVNDILRENKRESIGNKYPKSSSKCSRWEQRMSNMCVVSHWTNQTTLWPLKLPGLWNLHNKPGEYVKASSVYVHDKAQHSRRKTKGGDH